MRSVSDVIVGIDEVGRGAWAGPFVAAVVCLPKKFVFPKDIVLCDSKELSEQQRERSADFLFNHKEIFTFCSFISVKKVNALKLQECQKHLFEACLKKVSSQSFSGRQHIFIDGLPIKNFSFPATFVIKGDKSIPAVSAASIIAKVSRDRYMRHLGKKIPHYGFEKHKGYGTAAHLEALKTYGVSAHHRLFYRPIQKLLSYPLIGSSVSRYTKNK